MELIPGEDIFWHSDADETLDADNCRLHIHIFVNQETYSQLSHVNYFWQPGELWYGDFSFPNRLSNRGKKSRFYLVLDLVKNDFSKLFRKPKISYSIIALFLVSGWYNHSPSVKLIEN